MNYYDYRPEPESSYSNIRTGVRLPHDEAYRRDPAALSGPVITYRMGVSDGECGKSRDPR